MTPTNRIRFFKIANSPITAIAVWVVAALLLFAFLGRN